MDVDIACVGFGPAMGGFLTTLTKAWTENPTDPAFESKVIAGMPLQVVCYERADDLAAGVSGVVTRARGIRHSLPNLKPEENRSLDFRMRPEQAGRGAVETRPYPHQTPPTAAPPRP